MILELRANKNPLIFCAFRPALTVNACISRIKLSISQNNRLNPTTQYLSDQRYSLLDSLQFKKNAFYKTIYEDLE